MISHKQQMVVTNVFRRLGMALLIATAWIVGVELIVYLLDLWLNHNWVSFLVSLKAIPGTVTKILLWIVPFYFLVTPYADFKWTIQNGISRKTMWRGRLLSLILATIVAYAVESLCSLIDHPFGDWVGFWLSLLAYFSVVITMAAIGNGFALLNRKWKWIVGIGLPIVALILFVSLISWLSLIDKSVLYHNSQFILRVLNSLNFTVIFWVSWGAYLLIMVWSTKFFNDRIQLRRD
ncbi:membrane protein [Limosilactobacillus frumenti DSM 13145]|uniref:Membrane protein n=1 Tax=Limosilactobacillus frumenti DSM 13145 TaxID=1423746 RepID=A0A0R1PF40_9LACO|nr:hypothetical protein [Limosilactobacillus frumenti]KRL28314.1 membrane protein [Limosilactobacillus frumenti DSM 13145]MBA2914649.1 hypothetical protein [Limosilactobacillus frumenti]QFG72930.1 hypothetical protein LF145_06195 [Limosilactobacillus frumenti]